MINYAEHRKYYIHGNSWGFLEILFQPSMPLQQLDRFASLGFKSADNDFLAHVMFFAPTIQANVIQRTSYLHQFSAEIRRFMVKNVDREKRRYCRYYTCPARLLGLELEFGLWL